MNVFDYLEFASKSIKNIKTLADAIRSGTDYLLVKHPNLADDLIAMCKEMKKTSVALASASSIITHFAFVIDDNMNGEAARFNNHLVNHKKQARGLAQSLDSLRGHCSIIKKHHKKIDENSNLKGIKSILFALGINSKKKEKELADALKSIYDEEVQYHHVVWSMEKAINESLDSIEKTLGKKGTIKSENVLKAANLLGKYAKEFARIESNSKQNARKLQLSIEELRLQK